MIDLFYSLYNYSFKLQNRFLAKIKILAVFRYLLVVLLNVLAPLYFRIIEVLGLNNGTKVKTDICVSMTSFPLRINRIHLSIRSIIHQTYSPKNIYLYLSKEQFQGEENLPKSLLRLRKYGLIICFQERDLRSYKKYYYRLKTSPDEPFIIMDDDIIYSSNILKKLIISSKNYPTSIICNRASWIDKNSRYSKWKLVDQPLQPSFFILPTGCGGVLYPTDSLHIDALNQELFMDLAPYGDDLWLNAMAYLKGTDVVHTGFSDYLLPILYLKNSNLHSANTGDNGLNDVQMQKIDSYYMKKLSRPIFIR
jgi:hypothetical protein